MSNFKRQAFWRIALVTLLLAVVAAPVAWVVARENAEAEIVAFAQEESRRVLVAADAIDLQGDQATQHAQQAATSLVGGLFDIVEIYDRRGQKLAEATTPAGGEAEATLPKHGQPSYAKSFYENFELPDGRWALRVFVPLAPSPEAGITGYFEGVRLVPTWQHDQIRSDAFVVAAMVCLASLVCGTVIYPVVILLSAENERRARQVLESHIAMMEALGRAIAKRDSDTGTHNYRVAWIAATMGEALGLAGAAMQSLIAGSFLHDVGKIGIPDAILLKPGRLDAQEMTTMRTHVVQGQEIVSGAGWLQGAAEVVSCHHEKWDGTGYPLGLSGAAIPLSARIFAVADVYDALSSRRPYKAPLPFDVVMAQLADGAGQHFDPQVLAVFQRLAPGIQQRLQGLEEAAIQSLMADMITRHFDALSV